MPFAIDNELCARCGSCIGSCPNRAIVRQEDRVYHNRHVLRLRRMCALLLRGCNRHGAGESRA